VGDSGRQWETVGDGGRWWETVGDGGRRHNVVRPRPCPGWTDCPVANTDVGSKKRCDYPFNPNKLEFFFLKKSTSTDFFFHSILFLGVPRRVDRGVVFRQPEPYLLEYAIMHIPSLSPGLGFFS